MKFAICDDTQDARQLLENLLTEYATKTSSMFELFFYDSGEALLHALKKISFHVVFLDVYMQKLNGIDTAREIRKFDKSVQIVFVTTSLDHAVASYDVQALYYIVKPISYSRIEKVLTLCQLQAVQDSRQIEILSDKVMIPIKLSEIIYAEIFNKILAIHTINGIINSKTSMENLNILLGGAPFLHCHRSYVVNMDFIAEMEDDAFVLNNGESVPISRPSKALSLKIYHEFVFSNMRRKIC